MSVRLVHPAKVAGGIVSRVDGSLLKLPCHAKQSTTYLGGGVVLTISFVDNNTLINSHKSAMIDE